jgi:hypothetical protein
MSWKDNINSSIDEDVAAVDAVNSGLIYLGYSVSPGVADTDRAWKIKQVTISGTVIRFKYAEGSRGYGFQWSQRASYTYK